MGKMVAGGGYEIGDQDSAFDAGRGLNARRHINAGRTGRDHSTRDIFRMQPSSQEPGPGKAAALQKLPVEGGAMAARAKSLGCFGIEEKHIGVVVITGHGGKILGPCDGKSLDQRGGEMGFDGGGPLRRFTAMELEKVGAHRLDGCRQPGIIGIGHQGDQANPAAQMIGERPGGVETQMPGRFGMENQADKIRTRPHRGIGRFGSVYTANFYDKRHEAPLIAVRPREIKRACEDG